ncbi:MAG: FkbM family methyltransferase [Pirellulaceae bacterium]
MLEHLKWYLRARKYKAKVEPQEIDFVIDRVQPGEVAVDIGAYKGAFSYWMCRRAGRTGQVFAFEPQPLLADYLRRLARGKSYWHVEQLALSDREGEAELVVPLTPGRERVSQMASLHDSWENLPPGEQRMRVPVRLTTLDAYFGQSSHRPVKFIKCDAEGHELRVFQGGEQVLREDRPTLLFECENRQPERAPYVLSVFAYLEGLGYRGYYFDRQRDMPRPITPQAIEPFYSHNFAFLPEEAGQRPQRAEVRAA